MDGMAAKRTRSYTRVRPGLPRRGAQHHTSVGSQLPPLQADLSRPDTTWSAATQNYSTPAVSLSDTAAESLANSQMLAEAPVSEPKTIAATQPHPAVFMEPLLSESSHSRRLDADGDVAAMSEPFAEESQHGQQTDVYGWDAELDRQIEAGPRPIISANRACGCDLDYTYRRKSGGKRSLLHRVFSLGSSTTGTTSVKVRRSASSST